MEAREMSENLYRAVKSRYGFIKMPNFQKWNEEFEKMNKIDGWSWNMINLVMQWSQQDEFWRQQIRSPHNLRKHFEKMMVNIQESENSKTRIWKV